MALSTESSLSEIGGGVYASQHGGQKYASIDQGSAGKLTAIAAVTGNRIRVLAAVLTAVGTAPSLTFKSDDGTTETQLSGEIDATQSLSLVLPFNPAGWMQTRDGEALVITTANGPVNGVLVYEEVGEA